MAGPTTPLVTAIQATGMTVNKFCEEVLGLKYGKFAYRTRTGGLSLEDYHRILYHTGRTFEELFPNPYRRPAQAIPLAPDRPLPLTAATHTGQSIQAPPPVTPAAPVVPEMPKSQPARVTPPAGGFKALRIDPPMEPEKGMNDELPTWNAPDLDADGRVIVPDTQ